ETNALSKPVTSNSVSTQQESKGVNNDKVIASRMFRINPSKTSREDKHVPNTISTSNRTKPITVLQPSVITKKDMNSDLNGLSSTGVDNTKTRRPKFAKQPIVENLPNIGKTNALSKPVTSNSVSSPQEPKGVNNDKVITPGMFRINPSTTSREEKHVPNTVSASARTKPITVSQPHVITKKDVNSDLNGLSSTGVDNIKTKRPKPKRNTKHDRNDHEDIGNLGAKGLPKFKYHKEHLCPSCEQRKSKRASHPPKPVPNSRQRLHLLHMDLCGPMIIASINGKRTKKIMETMNVSFDELSAMAFEQRSSKLGLQSMTSGHISSGLDLTYAPSTITMQQPSEGELDLLFAAMYDEYFGGQPSATARTVPPVQEPQVHRT
nr:Gag-Pol polyprotein [Tanacetum cinerariifolium]